MKTLSRPQRLTLEAVRDGSVGYANPRTIRSLIERELVVWLGPVSPYGGRREYRLTPAGEAALS